MKKKILVTAIASALIAPAAFAAEGRDGMNYTSASEGFYGSLRARFDTGSTNDDESVLNNGGTSQVGVAGTLDMGNGLTGFYQWEVNVGGTQSSATRLRKQNVGIRGAFGEVKFGSFTDSMIGVSGHTDVTNSISGNFDLTPGDNGTPGNNNYRVDSAVQYTTPDLNGFQANVRVIAAGADDNNTVDDWAINANYSIQGLTAVAGYRVETDGLAEVAGTEILVTDSNAANNTLADKKSQDDASRWGAGLGYGQDNWNVGFWYGEADNQNVVADPDGTGAEVGAENFEDTEYFSVAGAVTVGKTVLSAFTETASNVNGAKGIDNTVSGVGVQYNFTANSRVWIDYQANDRDDIKTEDDKVVIGLRHDF